MVFGAMTQANGFESGFNIKNVKWTNDYWTISSNTVDVQRITGIFLNPAGSNVYFINTAPISGTTNVLPFLHILQLSEPFKLSSVIRRVHNTPSAFTRVSGAAMQTNGRISFYSTHYNSLIQSNRFLYSAVTFGSNYVFPMRSNGRISSFTVNGSIPSPFLYFCAATNTSPEIISCHVDVAPGSNITSSQKTVYTTGLDSLPTQLSFIIPYQNLYNTGLAGVEVDIVSSNKRLYTLETVNIVANTMHLACTYFNSSTFASSSIRQNIQRVNLYPLIPTALKPLRAHGMCVDRKNGQYLYICCDINPSATQAILKFQLR